MMSVALDMGSNKDLDYSHLLAQNKALLSELTQCQADKDFVWSLWKRLQVSNPDVTETISLVIQREKEKAEAKDHKVLEILQVKDDRIEELQNIVAKQSQEISELLGRKVDLQEKAERLRSETEHLQDQRTTLELKLKGYETKERSMDSTYRRTVEDTQREKYELQRKVNALTTELEVARDEKASIISKRLDLEHTVRNLERDVSEKISKFDGLIRELEETRKMSDKAGRQVQQLTHEVDFKNQELESIRKELKDLWNSHNQLTEHSAQQAHLIQQLQSLQHDTQIMIKNQEDAFSVEAKSLQQMYQDVCLRYETAKLLESELRQQILHLKKDLMERDDMVSKLQEQGQAMQDQLTRPDAASSFLDTDLAAADRSTLEARRDLAALRQLEKTIDRLDQSLDKDGTLDFDLSHTHRSGRHSTPSKDGTDSDLSQRAARRARSLSPRRFQQEPGSERQLKAEQKLADAERLLELKDKELETIRRAHARRLERLRSVQNSEKLLQEQLKTFEETQPNYLGPGRKKKQPKRSDPRQLQRENSDAVWNELSYFKSQHRTLEVERLSLQEEVDELRVQASIDAATVHELRVNLQAQREEFEYQLKKREMAAADRKDVESELIMLRSKVQNKEIHARKLETDMQEIAADRDKLMEEKKTLKTHANELQQEVSQCRIQIADLRHALQRQDRALEESLHSQSSQRHRETSEPPKTTAGAVSKPTRRKPSHRFKKPGGSSSVKQYQRVLNTSIEKMSGLFSNFRDDGWEEVTESGETDDADEWEEDDDDTQLTGDSLGGAIARQAREPTNSTGTASTPYAANLRKLLSAKPLQKGKDRSRIVLTKAKETRQSKPSQPKASAKAGPSSPDRAPSPRRSRSPTPRERVVLREVATSPIPWEARQEQEKARAARGMRVAGSQTRILKQRVAQLSQQLATFRDTRQAALKKFEELKTANQQLTSDLAQANQRLRTARQTCQRLSSDIERLQQEKKNQDLQLLAKDKSELVDKHNDSDKRLLEARLKMATSEVSRQAATIRTLKTEVDTLQDQVRGFQDRINHLERDNNQKRNLLESQRIKLKTTQDAGKTHDDALEELHTKVKLSTDNTEKMRVQLDSLKKRMRVVTQEKRDYEDKYLQVSLALEKKAKELSACREQRSQLEAAMSQLETLSQQQLQRVATHSEVAVDAAQAQVSATHGMLACYQQFVKLLCSELLDRVTRARRQLREAAAATAAKEEMARAALDSDTASLKRAQDMARDILNISQSDMDDIMSADGDHAAWMQDSSAMQDSKRDKKWLRKCEKIMASKEDFVRPLVSLVLQKVDERADLMMRLAS